MTTITKEQLLKFEQLLLARRGGLREELLSEHDDSSADSSHEVRHGGEEYFEKLLKDVGTGIEDIHTRELRDINAALERIASGQYGICMDCGESIGLPRLEAFPAAPRCIDCKERLEHMQSLE